jgi:hypothetical protein
MRTRVKGHDHNFTLNDKRMNAICCHYLILAAKGVDQEQGTSAPEKLFELYHPGLKFKNGGPQYPAAAAAGIVVPGSRRGRYKIGPTVKRLLKVQLHHVKKPR